MRPVCLAFFCISVTGASLLAADRVPSAVRARQIPAGSQFRNVQDSPPPKTFADDEPGPKLGEPAPMRDEQPLRDEQPFGSREVVPDAANDPAAPAVPAESIGPTFPENPRAAPTFDPGLTPTPELGPSRATVPFQPGLATPNVAAKPGPTADRDFWIVSSRQCPQQGARPCLTCGLGYFQCNRGGRPGRSDEAAFRRSLQPGVPICIVVHGSFTDWETVCDDACATNRWLHAAAPHLPMQMIFYSWPSDPQTVVLPPIDIEVMGTRAGFNGIYLSLLVQRLPKESPICMIGHSHGARAIAACEHLLGGGDIQGYRYQNVQAIPHRIRTVFLAGAIDHHWLTPGQQYGNAIARTEALLNIKNSQDWALGFYSWRAPFSGTAVGREGLSMRDLSGMGPYVSRVRELDVAPLLRGEHLFPAYVRRPEIATAAVPYVYFTDLPTADGASNGIAPAVAPLIPADQAARRTPAGYVQRYQPLPDSQRRTATPSPGTRYSSSPYSSYGGNSWPVTNTQPAGAYSPANGYGRGPIRAQTGPGQFPAMAPRNAPPGSSSLQPLPATPPARMAPASAPPAIPQRSPATLGLPETTSNAPKPLEGAAVTRTTVPNNRLGSSLQPINRPQPAAAPPAVEETHPVHVEQKPFERPKTKLPPILRRYYPEASREGAEPAA